MNNTAELVARIETLEEENRQLRDAMRPEDDSKAWRLGLSKSELAMFKRLEVAQMASYDALLSVLELTNNRPSLEINVKVMVSRMRKKLRGSGYVIRTVWGVGYRLEGPSV